MLVRPVDLRPLQGPFLLVPIPDWHLDHSIFCRFGGIAREWSAGPLELTRSLRIKICLEPLPNARVVGVSPVRDSIKRARRDIEWE